MVIEVSRCKAILVSSASRLFDVEAASLGEERGSAVHVRDAHAVPRTIGVTRQRYLFMRVSSIVELILIFRYLPGR